MNVVLPEKEKLSKKRIVVYIVLIAICVIALVVAVCVQILGADFTNSIFGVSTLKTRTEEEEQELRLNFDNLFSNNLQISEGMPDNIVKIDDSQEYVYTSYENGEKDTGNYELSVNIPYINIKEDVIEEYNNEIKEIFQDKVESILDSSGRNILFTVEYQAYIENNILSLIIRSNLKQGSSAQQVVVQTYNYDLINKKEVTLEDEIKLLGLNQYEVQNKIRQEIKDEQNKAEDLQELGYQIYSRDSESDIYDIENSDIFFFHNENLYIIYPYGNDALTSEMDMVII